MRLRFPQRYPPLTPSALLERAHVDIDLPVQPEFGCQPASMFPDHADRMGLVEQQQRAVWFS